MSSLTKRARIIIKKKKSAWELIFDIGLRLQTKSKAIRPLQIIHKKKHNLIHHHKSERILVISSSWLIFSFFSNFFFFAIYFRKSFYFCIFYLLINDDDQRSRTFAPGHLVAWNYTQIIFALFLLLILDWVIFLTL
jgi:hypothetical protein